MADDVTIDAFTRQVSSFEGAGSHFGDVDLLEWIASQVPVGPRDRVLDVAGGTGQVGRHLGRRARTTVVVDLTPAMLGAGAAAVADEHRHDVAFVRGNVVALPFSNGGFEVVVCRFALHHFREVKAALLEMYRVCAPGGTVAVIDMVAEVGPRGERMDELERLRDPSHVAAPREDELREQVSATGLKVVAAAVRDDRQLAEEWLERAQPSPEARNQVLSALSGEAGGGPATGLHAARTTQGLTINRRNLLLRATRV